MGDEVVCDASVAVKCLFDEELSGAALDLARRYAFRAPDLVLIELSSVGAKKVKRGEASMERAERALARAPELFAELPPAISLRDRAFSLATLGKVSVYDALYLALAEARGLSLVTVDQRLVRGAEAAGLSSLVTVLV